METWNREQLYAEVWEQPLVKVAPKYGISAVALGKVCDKLQTPLPSRGFWTKKESTVKPESGFGQKSHVFRTLKGLLYLTYISINSRLLHSRVF